MQCTVRILADIQWSEESSVLTVEIVVEDQPSVKYATKHPSARMKNMRAQWSLALACAAGSCKVVTPKIFANKNAWIA